MSESLPLPNWESHPQHAPNEASLHAASSERLSHQAGSRPPSFRQGPGSEQHDHPGPHRGRLDSSTTSSIISGWHQEDGHTQPRSEEGLSTVGTEAWIGDQHSRARSDYAGPEFRDMPSCREDHKQQVSRHGSRGFSREVEFQQGGQVPPRSASTTRASIQTRRVSNPRSEPQTHPASSVRTYAHPRPGDTDMDAPHRARSARRRDSVYTGTDRAGLAQEYCNPATSLASTRHSGRPPHDSRTAWLATIRRSRPLSPRRRRGLQLLWKRRLQATRCIAISWLAGFVLVIVLLVVLVAVESTLIHKKQ